MQGSNEPPGFFDEVRALFIHPFRGWQKGRGARPSAKVVLDVHPFGD